MTSNKLNTQKYICIYHANCLDGFAAAYAFNEWAIQGRSENVQFIPMNYTDKVPDVTGHNVIILDFSFKRDVLLALKNKANSVTLLDHHVSAMSELSGIGDCYFDLSKSGATLTWEYFFGGREIMPEIFKYIEDRDLWKWELPYSKEITAALQSYPKQFGVWDSFMDAGAVKKLKEEGKAILRYIETETINTILSGYSLMEIGGYTVPVVNTRHFHSEIGSLLSMAECNPFAATYYEHDGKRVFSLRSSKKGVDVSVIAKNLGGGGHKTAAGFTLTADQFDLVKEIENG